MSTNQSEILTSNESKPAIHEVLVSVKNVSRYYGKNKAVDDISFEVHRGEILGLLGPNGAGKSTMMQMLTGNLAPSNGQIRINNFDILDEPKNAKLELGYLPEHPPVYNEFTIDEYLSFCAKLNRVSSSHKKEAIKLAKERCGLNKMSKRLIGNLSKGYLQRVGIAQAIIHSPAVIILDEPTVGLDPKQIRDIRSLIRELGCDRSVILSTHILPEITATCDRVLIINNGQIKLTESIESLHQRMQSSSLLVAFKQPPTILELKKFNGILDVDEVEPGRFRLHHDPKVDLSEKIITNSVEKKWRLTEIVPEKLSLEEIFIDITCTEQDEKIAQTHNQASHEKAQ